jgi:hypothetical protein
MRNGLEITNDTIWTIDWARHDRQRFLHSLDRPRQPLSRRIGGVPANQIWGQDVSAMDQRSVKAQLAGRGGWRATWWNLNESLHRLFKPAASTETIMYVFHKRHHTLTLTYLVHWSAFQTIVDTVRREGAWQAWRSSWEIMCERINSLR